MVSAYPIPPPGKVFSRFYGCMGGDPTELPGMNGYSNNLVEMPPMGSVGVDDHSKKIRKPYTITKSRESWSEQEHDKFVEALHLFDRDWKKIEAFVGSKSVIQIRSHAQKYFLKVQKNGTSEHVPAPRPKRKAAHPYPHKASKHVASQATGPLQSSTTFLEPGYTGTPDSLPITRTQTVNGPLPWTYNIAPPGHVTCIPKDDVGLVSVPSNCSSSNNGSARVLMPNERPREVKVRRHNSSIGMPDFAQVYSFIGSVFDPTASDHVQRLKNMNPIDVQTTIVLMKNLAANLSSPEFENHVMELLSSYSFGIANSSMGSAITSC